MSKPSVHPAMKGTGQGTGGGAKGTAHWGYLFAWVLALLSPASLVYRSVFTQGITYAGLAAGGFLVLRVITAGFTGFERKVGLGIIRRDHTTNAVGWVRVCAALTVVGMGALVGFQTFGQDASFMSDPAIAGWVNLLRLALVITVAIATFFGLLLLIAQRFSVFGTTSIFGVVLGVAALLVVQSVATGFQHEFERRVLGVYAHVNVTRAFGISEYRRFEKWLRTVPGVEGASPFVYYAMALAPYDPDHAREGDLRLASVLVKGIEPTTAHEVIDLADHLERGSGRPVPLTELRSDHVLMPVPDRPEDQLPNVIAATPDPRGQGWYADALDKWRVEGDSQVRPIENTISDGTDDWEDPPALGEVAAPTQAGKLDTTTLPTMFVGNALAKELDLEVGNVVRLVDPGATFDHTEEPRFTYYLVAGVFQAGFQEYDSRLVYVDIKELERFKYRDKDIVSGVDLRLTHQDLAPEVGATIRQRLGDEYSVLEWHKLNENLFSSIETQKNIITVILSLVIFVASFNVLSALWTMVMRRTPEVAILMSMGATGPQVSRIFQVTGMTIGLAGSLAGVIYGLVMCWLVRLYGYTLDPEVYFIEELPVEISILQIVGILGLALTFCFIATIPPSLRAASLRPVEGLRYE